MRAVELRSLLDRRPFRPLRIYISSGEYMDVIHPEMAIVSRSLVAVGLPPRRRVAEVIAHYSLIHVVKIVPLADAALRRYSMLIGSTSRTTLRLLSLGKVSATRRSAGSTGSSSGHLSSRCIRVRPLSL